METGFGPGLVGFLGTLIVAAATYWLAKRGEAHAELRQEKLKYYKAFMESLSGIMEGEDTPEGQQAYTLSCNNLCLFAPNLVLEALKAYRTETQLNNPD